MRWHFTALLVLQAHFAASYLVPLDVCSPICKKWIAFSYDRAGSITFEINV